MADTKLRREPFTGEALLELLRRPEPAPISAGIPPLGNLSLLIAPAFTGKTSLVCWLAMARAAGVAPWDGAPTLAKGAALILSPDEAVEQLVRRMDGLSRRHPAGPLEQYAWNLHVLGPDPYVDERELASLRFDSAGLARLGARLERATTEGHPFADVFVDAYADVLPLGESENDNGSATRIGGALQALAVKHGCSISLLHHAGKPPKDTPDDADVRFLGRGASALAAKARAVFSLEQITEMPWARRIRTITNLGKTPPAQLFEVSPEGTDGELSYFKPIVRPLPRQLHPRDFLRDGQEVTTTELGDLLAPRLKLSGGELKRATAAVRNEWVKLGLIEVTDGARGAKLVRLRDDPERVTR